MGVSGAGLETKVHLNGSLHPCWVVQALPPVELVLEIQRWAAPHHVCAVGLEIVFSLEQEGESVEKEAEKAAGPRVLKT